MIKHFFQKIYRTCTDKSFYIEAVQDTFGQRLLYLFILLWITGAIATGFLGVETWKWIQKMSPAFFAEASYELDHFFPADLKVTIEKGVLSTNQPTPVTYTPRYLKNESSEDGFEYAIVLDPKSTVTIDTCKCIALISSTGLSVRTDKKVEYRTFEQVGIKSDKSITVDKTQYDSLKKQVAPYITNGKGYLERLFYVILGFMILVGPVFSTVSWLSTLVLWSLIGWVTAKIISRPSSYAEVYLMGMYLITPLILLELVSTLIVAPLATGPMPLIIYAILVAIFVPVPVIKSHHTA